MGVVLFLLLLAVPVAELWVIGEVADGIGLLSTLVLLLLVSIAGAWLLKQQGVATWRRLRATLARGEVPTREATDGALILLGGALLLTPGFLTDAVGLFLLVPVTRATIKGIAGRFLGRWAKRRFGYAGPRRPRVQAARVVRVERREDGASSPASPPPDPLPSGEAPDGGDGSRGSR